MTDIRELLQRATDVPVAVDVAGDLARGRAAARSRRHRLAAAGGAVVLLAVVAVAAGASLDHGDQRATDPARVADPAPPSASPSPSPSASESPTQSPAQSSPPAQRITAAPVDPATLVHTDYFDVPPPPRGWYLVGAQASYVMMARDGSDADLTGRFAGRLMVLLTAATPDMPGADATPLVLRGRTFYESGGVTRGISVELDDGDWLTVQYPRDAGLALPEMVAFLEAVTVLPGAMSVS